MREISFETIRDTVAALAIEACCRMPEPVTRGQGQSPALEGSAYANFRVTSPFPRGGRFRKSGRLEPALRY